MSEWHRQILYGLIVVGTLTYIVLGTVLGHASPPAAGP